ncbi:MAG TPA: alpha-amylase family glycosyl hydrolase, partial [Blastocatellia bacterium]|nr:alpha-amylase family glycosyl hydrolase [Blastocatellia bacterium]
LSDLGVNTLWLSPFNSTVAYHGYHIVDFLSVDPHFGSSETLESLIESAHERGMRIIMDFVPNHVHLSHPFFQDALEYRVSPYRRWFYFDQSNSYLAFLDIAELPKLNLGYPAAARHVTDAAIHWLDRGFDGLRLDHVIGPTKEFWMQFAKDIRARHSSAVLIGEVFLSGIRWKNLKTINIDNKWIVTLLQRLGFDATPLAMRQFEGILDGVLDFRFQSLVKRFVAKPRWNRPEWLLQALLRKHYRSFRDDFYLPSFLDNHDMSRFLYEAGQDNERLKHAARIQFAQNQPVVIYYGTEIGMTQLEATGPERPYSDLKARQMMIWDEASQDRGLLEFYRWLIRRRKVEA